MRNSIYNILRESKPGFNQRKGYHRSHQTKNTPALIQSLITRMKNQLEKDTDTFPELIKEVETYAGTCPDSASVAVLHSMIAEMYNSYYMQNRWNINQRTQLAGYGSR